MRNIKLIIEYDGTDFNGWQTQARGERTVQSEIREAVLRLTGEKVSIIGSGRTDAGVHAAGQAANFKTHSKLTVRKIRNALNAHLPDDIRITAAVEVDEDFHSQYSAITKTYRYSVYNRDVAPTYQARTCWHFPYKVNFSCLKREAAHLVGRKDFKAFQASDPSRKKISTIREITEVKVRRKGDIITIDITANGFLYKMVRQIVGTLMEVATGKLPEGTIPEMIRTKKRSLGGKTAPPQGLCLVSVFYS